MDEPSKAAQLAAVLTGNASTRYRSATVQRSNRFYLHKFMLIENMVKIADCSVAAMINQVIEVEIDSLYEYLPLEMAKNISIATLEKVYKTNSQINQAVGKCKAKK